jgi:hypothetical protein
VVAGIDLVVIGIGAFLVLGRLGCLSMGCCHGRPHGWGVRYEARHAALGFPSYYVGVPLLPIQAFASAAHLGLSAGCALLYVTPHADGSVIGFYFALYAPTRFAVELLRGDPERGHALGLSYAQWLCLAIAWTVVALCPGFSQLYAASAVAVTVLALVVVALRRQLSLTGPAHIRELAEALEALDRSSEPTPLVTTGAGLRISRTPGHIALSSSARRLGPRQAQTLGGYIAIFEHIVSPELEPGDTAGVYHLRWTPRT